jgi:hypothetical protein
MDSNTHSTGRSDGRSEGLAGLAAAVDDLAAQDLEGLADSVRAERVLELRRLVDRLEGQWLKELAGVDAHGAAGADQAQEIGSTAGWLRSRLRLGAGAAAGSVRTARALFGGPLAVTAAALTAGELSPAHARVLAVGTQELPEQVTVEAEAVLVEAAGRLDPPRLRRVLGHLQLVADPDGAEDRAERRQQRRGLWLAPTFEGLVAVDGLLEAEAGQSLLAALEPLARPADATDTRSGGQRRADGLAELARRSLEAGRLPQAGGVRPQLLVTVELDSLLDRPGAVGGEAGWAGPLDPEACRRLACDGAVTRVLVTRHPNHHPNLLDPTDKEARQPQIAEGSRRRQPATPATIPIPATTPPGTWGPVSSYGRPWPCCPRSWVGHRPSRWRSAAPAGSSRPPSGPPCRCATAAVGSPPAPAPWPGAKPTICATGCMAAPPTWPTWPWCAEPTTARCMRAAGGFTAAPTGA